MKDNMFVMTMYAGAFLIALYKKANGKINEEKLKGLVCAAAYSPLMVKAKQGKSAFTEKEIAGRTKQAKWSSDHNEQGQSGLNRVCEKPGCEITNGDLCFYRYGNQICKSVWESKKVRVRWFLLFIETVCRNSSRLA